MQPYLFAFILIVGGLIAAVAVLLTDRGILDDEARWKADGERSVFGITRLAP